MKSQTAGYQRWSQLLFLHWRIDPDVIQEQLPSGLSVETFDDSAWLALVPFSMERVRPWWSPPVPGISWFLETNVRTYVKHVSGQTGVWFFSLDANSRLAVAVARKFWHLNYQSSDMHLHADADMRRYGGKRIGHAKTSYAIVAQLDSQSDPTRAADGTLEHFLLERYHLIAQRPDLRFVCGQVHHEPYRCRPLSHLTVRQTMAAAAGIQLPEDQPPDHMTWCPGVDVRISPLKVLPG
ncbi:MAG: DUF2071 domain-containing protein [Planctomycetaceae bacterium]